MGECDGGESKYHGTIHKGNQWEGMREGGKDGGSSTRKTIICHLPLKCLLEQEGNDKFSCVVRV